MKTKITLIILIIFGWACSGDSSQESSSKNETKTKKETKAKDNSKGIGEFKSVELNDPLDMDMVNNGRAIYELKCSACHKLTAQRVVGPGWKGVTEKRKPEWIMNMITNVDIMLDEDPTARALFEECLTRMPNQNVSPEEARDILEFIYHNDAEG